MYAIEFQTKIQNGSISVPEKYRGRFKDRVRVILMADEESQTDNYIEYLLANPVKLREFSPLSRDELYERS